MMDDIVGRLDFHANEAIVKHYSLGMNKLLNEAKAEILRLREERDGAVTAEREAIARMAYDLAHSAKIAMQNYKVLGKKADVERHDHYRSAYCTIANAIDSRPSPRSKE